MTTTASQQFRLGAMAAGMTVGLSVEEGATLAGISRSRMYEEIMAGRIRSMKRGKRRLLTPAAIAEWLSDQPVDGILLIPPIAAAPGR